MLAKSAVLEGYQERIGKGELSRDARVAHHVRQHHPGGKWTEGEFSVALGISSKGRRVFHVIVKLSHPPVVGRAVDHPQHRQSASGAANHPRIEAIQWAFFEWARSSGGYPRRLAESTIELWESPLGGPDAIFRRMDIGEESQDAVAVSGAVCPGIDVDQLVAGVR